MLALHGCEAEAIGSVEEAMVRLVVIESPYAGDVERNREYLLAAMHDCLQRGEAPFASHELYTRVLRDTVPAERAKGIMAGLEWGRNADATVVYEDLGVSAGMVLGIKVAIRRGRTVEFRRLRGWSAFVRRGPFFWPTNRPSTPKRNRRAAHG